MGCRWCVHSHILGSHGWGLASGMGWSCHVLGGWSLGLVPAHLPTLVHPTLPPVLGAPRHVPLSCCVPNPASEDSSWVTGGRPLSIVPCWCGPELRVLPTLSPPSPHPPKLHLEKQGSPYITSYTWREWIRRVWRCLETPGPPVGCSVTQFPHCLGQVRCS